MLSCAENPKMNEKTFTLIKRSHALSEMANKLNEKFSTSNITNSKISNDNQHFIVTKIFFNNL